MYGNGIDIPALVKVSRPYDCVVIEDCAQSAGTEIYNKSSGTLAQAGTYSFFPTKNLPALGDGGGVWIPSKKLKQKIESLRQYGWDNKRIVTVPNGMNSRLDSNIETVFLMASENQQFISSRLVKEIFMFGGDISSFVSSNVLKEMKLQKKE